MTDPFEKIFKPLYGVKPSSPLKPQSKKPQAVKQAKPDQNIDQYGTIFPTAAEQVARGKHPRGALVPTPEKGHPLAGFVKDNKTLLLIVVFIIILIVVGVLVYKQKKQTRDIARLVRKFKRLK